MYQITADFPLISWPFRATGCSKEGTAPEPCTAQRGSAGPRAWRAQQGSKEQDGLSQHNPGTGGCGPALPSPSSGAASGKAKARGAGSKAWSQILLCCVVLGREAPLFYWCDAWDEPSASNLGIMQVLLYIFIYSIPVHNLLQIGKRWWHTEVVPFKTGFSHLVSVFNTRNTNHKLLFRWPPPTSRCPLAVTIPAAHLRPATARCHRAKRVLHPHVGHTAPEWGACLPARRDLSSYNKHWVQQLPSTSLQDRDKSQQIDQVTTISHMHQHGLWPLAALLAALPKAQQLLK